MKFVWLGEEGDEIVKVLDEDGSDIYDNFKRFILIYPKSIKSKNRLPKYLRDMDKYMSNRGESYTDAHSQYLRKHTEKALKTIKELPLRQELSEGDFVDNKMKIELNLDNLDKEFKIGDVFNQKKSNLLAGKGKIRVVEDLTVAHYIDSIKEEDLDVEVKGDTINIKLKLDDEEVKKEHWSDNDMKLESVVGELDEGGINPTKPKELKFDDEDVPMNIFISRDNPKQLKNIIMNNKQKIFANIGSTYLFEPRIIHDVDVEISLILKGERENVKDAEVEYSTEIQTSTIVKPQKTIKFEGEKTGKEILDITPDAEPNVHRSNIFYYIKSRINKLEKAINLIPEGEEN
tara:strand:- start:533 stop:1570 length:1038 start_codon:yes stop_codon:yes gene_type:complete